MDFSSIMSVKKVIASHQIADEIFLCSTIKLSHNASKKTNKKTHPVMTHWQLESQWSRQPMMVKHRKLLNASLQKKTMIKPIERLDVVMVTGCQVAVDLFHWYHMILFRWEPSCDPERILLCINSGLGGLPVLFCVGQNIQTVSTPRSIPSQIWKRPSS